MAEAKIRKKDLELFWTQFRIGIANDLVNALARRAPVDSGFLRNSIRYQVNGNVIRISMVDYAIYVEFGTPPHIIEPRNAKALRFNVSGIGPRGGDVTNTVFAKIVHHPGTRPQPFIRTTFAADLPSIIKENIMRFAVA